MNFRNILIIALFICNNIRTAPLSEALNNDMTCSDGSEVTKITKHGKFHIIDIYSPNYGTEISIKAPAPKPISPEIKKTEVFLYDSRNSTRRTNLQQWFNLQPSNLNEQHDRDAHCFALRVDQIVQLYGVLVDFNNNQQRKSNLILEGKMTDHKGNISHGVFEYAFYHSRGKNILYHRLFNDNPNRLLPAIQCIRNASNDDISGMDYFQELKKELSPINAARKIS